jgi:hypothetical protein
LSSLESRKREAEMIGCEKCLAWEGSLRESSGAYARLAASGGVAR